MKKYTYQVSHKTVLGNWNTYIFETFENDVKKVQEFLFNRLPSVVKEFAEISVTLLETKEVEDIGLLDDIRTLKEELEKIKKELNQIRVEQYIPRVKPLVPDYPIYPILNAYSKTVI